MDSTLFECPGTPQRMSGEPCENAASVMNKRPEIIIAEKRRNLCGMAGLLFVLVDD
jgi:hypothetical protein